MAPTQQLVWVPPPPPGAPTGVLARSTLPPVLARTLETFQLYDTTTLPQEEQDKVVGAIVAGFAVVFPLLYLKVGPHCACCT